MKFISVSYVPYPQSLRAILYILNNVVHEKKFPGMEFSTCGIMLGLKEFQNLEHFRFGMFGLGILSLFIYQ